MPAQDSTTAALEEYRAYLECLAFMRLDPRLRSKFGLSDVIQNTLLEAYRDLAQLQALDAEARKGWLRKAGPASSGLSGRFRSAGAFCPSPCSIPPWCSFWPA